MRRRLTILLAATALGLAGAGLALATAGGDGLPRAGGDPLLESGATRYAAYLRAEEASLRAARRSRDRLAVRLHAGRIAPAAGLAPAERVDPLGAVDAAVRLLSLDARHAGSAGLLGVEARVAGAAVAFDAIRDALWARDRGLTGSIDERLAGLRAELDRHRRGQRFRPATRLSTPDHHRLAAALDAYAWRLSLAVERVSR